MNARNYQRELDEVLKSPAAKGKKLFLHSCCAPCSSYVLEYLKQYFEITVFYYNPNITMPAEYAHRVAEQKRLIAEFNEMGDGYRISFVEGAYEPDTFFEVTKGHEHDKEGGARCYLCYEMRMRKAAQMAAEGGFDYFTTTLSISPMKNAAWMNEIGERLSAQYGVLHLPSDFKKKNGYKRSIELSKEYDLYRQDFCGCVYSKREIGEEHGEIS